MANRVTVLPFWDINLSVDYQWNKLNANLTDFPYPRRNTTLVAAATSLHFDRFKFQASVLGKMCIRDRLSPMNATGKTFVIETTGNIPDAYRCV